MKLCEVTNVAKTDNLGECGKPGVARIRDVECGGKPFIVCQKHKREFLSKKKNNHYKLVNVLG